jgi:hypothetical protein
MSGSNALKSPIPLLLGRSLWCREEVTVQIGARYTTCSSK